MLKEIISRYKQQIKSEWLYILMIAFVFSVGRCYQPGNIGAGYVILILLTPYIANKAYEWRKKQDEKIDNEITYCYNESEATPSLIAPTCENKKRVKM